jgi:hypothetical protein
MRQYDPAVETLRGLFKAYHDMRTRLKLIDRRLEQFHRKIARAVLSLAHQRQQRPYTNVHQT